MMDRIIRQITEHFVSRLPEEALHFTIGDLKNRDFPGFLLHRIHIELQRNLDESMILPDTEWANTRSDAVRQSWQQFLNAIHAEAKLPAPYAKAVIETAVADIILMLTEPRKNMTDILFGGEEVLSAEKLEERTELLVVYPHFAKVITGYMRRKTRDELSRSRCEKIVAQVDEKITRRYTPIQWAQMLDPLFTLGGGSVDTNLLRLFFEDRQMQRTAGKFDAIDETISRAEFVEVLSKPELWEQEDYRKEQAENSGEVEPADEEVIEEELIEEESAKQEAIEEEPTGLKKMHLDDIGLHYENIGEIHEDRYSSEKPASENSRELKDENIRESGRDENRRYKEAGRGSEDSRKKNKDSGHREPEEFQPSVRDWDSTDDKQSEPEIKWQQEDEKPRQPEPEIRDQQREEWAEPASTDHGKYEESDPEEEKQERTYSLNSFFAESDEDEESGDRSGSFYSSDSESAESETAPGTEDEDSGAEPIWMRFRNQNDSKKESNEEIMPRFVEIEDEQGRWSENLARESNKEAQTQDADYQLKELKERLSNERGYFVDELFNGSVEAYEESLEKVAKENTWKKASKLIEQDIFKRNNVNIFSAVAVNFIDRLQNYFMEKHNRN